MILVRVPIELDYEVVLEVQDSGAYLLTFPGFPEIKPLAFPSSPRTETMRYNARSALEVAIYLRLGRGQALPVPAEKKGKG